MRVRILCVPLVLAALSAAQPEEAARPARLPVRGLRGAVAAGTDFAADAGMRMFYAGGNAVDAGVAAMLAAAVAEYSHFGFGGEAPILIRTKEGKVVSIPGVGPMPKAATSEFFRTRKTAPAELLRPEPKGLAGFVPSVGLLPALVPGMVDAALLALRDYGTRSFAEAVLPAIELADGMPMDETRAAYIARSAKFFEQWPTSKKVFMPEGKAPQPGDRFRQPDLARTLRAMAEVEWKALAAGVGRSGAIDAVRDYFYRGEIARKIDAFSRDNGGLLRYEDMASFRLSAEEPASTTYRGYRVYKPGFWSQGPSLLQALNILEGFDVKAMGAGSAELLHHLTETLKLVYADRDAYYGDPKLVSVPAERLLSKEYASERRQLITAAASLEFRPGAAGATRPVHPSEALSGSGGAPPSPDTTCVLAMDHEGTVFSATPSGAWLPAVIAGDTGIPLTQRAQSFLLITGHPNELAGGKRPRVTLSPTLVTREEHAYLALSTPGGDNQDQALLQVLLNVIEFGMNAQNAVEAPRVQTRHLVSSFDNHAMYPGDLLVDERIPKSVSAALAERGHKVSIRSRWTSGAAPVALRVLPNRVLEAAADPYGYRAARAW